MITYSKALLLTALGVMFCSGCMTEQQTPAAKEDTVDTDGVKARLEKLGAYVSANEQGEVSGVHLSNPQVTDAGLVHLKGLTSLETLELNNTQITDAGLVHLKELTSLYYLKLDNTQVTDAGLAHLEELTSLKYLELDNTEVTDAGVEKLKEVMPGITILRD